MKRPRLQNSLKIEDKSQYQTFFENLIQTLFLDGKLQVFQIAPSLHVVELKKAKGDTLEFQKVLVSSNSLCGSLKAVKLGRWVSTQINRAVQQFYRSLSTQLKDVVWKCDSEVEGKAAS